MSRFKPGQEIICVTEGKWESRRTETSFFLINRTKWVPQPGPKQDDVVTVGKCHEKGTHISLREYPDHLFYPETSFEPLPEISEIREHMNATANPVEYMGRRCPCGCGKIIAFTIV